VWVISESARVQQLTEAGRNVAKERSNLHRGGVLVYGLAHF